MKAVVFPSPSTVTFFVRLFAPGEAERVGTELGEALLGAGGAEVLAALEARPASAASDGS